MLKIFVLNIIIIFLIALNSCENNAKKELKNENDSTIYEPVMKYGFNVEDYKIEDYELQKKDLMSKVFERCEVESRDYVVLLDSAKDFFDVRKLRPGQKYSIFRNKKSLESEYLVYEKDLVDYVVFDLKRRNAELRHNKLDTIIRSVGASIKSNLWSTFVDLGIDPILSEDMSVLFSWTIDFFGIQKDDNFRVIYQEKVVNDTIFGGYGKILAAVFCNEGKSIYAIPFKVHPDSAERFFDRDGSSLRGAFLKAPLEYRRISSGFTGARMHPILRIVRPHYGVDYSAPAGTPVRSVGDGHITFCGWANGAGNYIKIKHTNGFETGYMHLKGFASGIKNGKRVSQGQVIGYVGSTGLSTGAHLDYRVWKNGSPMNPLKLGENQPKTDPVPAERMGEFNRVKDSIINLLNNIRI